MNYSENQIENRDNTFGINCGLNKTQQRIIKLLFENPIITTQAIADSLGISRRTVDNHISQLKKARLVEREGAKKNGMWIVKQFDFDNI